MSFSKMFDLLREKEHGKVVFVKCGHFYIAIEEDAVLLNDLLGLKCTCFRENTCKVGVPVNSIEKYISKLKELRYGYVVYDYDKTNIELRKISEGKCKENYVKNKNINWYLAFFTVLIAANIFTLIVGAPFESQRLFASSIVQVLL